ncbi:hypothetical protein IV203_022008 [Nitzschia inconspicua]|uniref:Uncharacterized protein n=1 Tax=Nitzschia inconspicua TaxID=303405 RepID=A0A9K3KHX4_9STRA|nr:hypothetical protein IV203_022008 [Nitzschia inconspicua]
MTSRKLQTTQITHVFQRKECIGGTTTTTNAAVETAVVTTPRQDDREEDAPATGVSSITASSFSSSLVATPRTSTGPSARLVTTGKKRQYVPLSSTQSSQDNDGQHEEEEDQEDNCKPRAKPSFPQDQDDRAIVNDIIPQEIIDLENQEEDGDYEEEDESDEHNVTAYGHQLSDFRPIEIVGESTARQIIKPYCVESATLIKEENFFESPFGKFAEQLRRRKITINRGVYCILSATGKSILKIGSTKNFRKRYNYFLKKYDMKEWRFFIMVDFNNTNETINERMNEIYAGMMTALAEASVLDPFQTFLVNTLMERGGDRLDTKETVWIQMIEIGLQYEFGVAVISEFAMFSRRVAQELYHTASTKAQQVMRHLSVLLSKARNGETIPLQELSSWMSGVKYLSSNVETSRCILGEQFREKFKDTLPLPPVANPRRTHDYFDTSKYTDYQKENGRMVFFQSSHDFLTERFKFKHIETILDGEIALYLDASQLHVVVLHRPVCVASDARICISHKLQWQRGIAVATLCNIGRLVRGEPVLSPKDRFSNPIHAMLAFHIIIVIREYHGGLRHAAAFYRDFVTPETTKAILYNGLTKATENAPVAQQLRQKYVSARGQKRQEKLDKGEKFRCHDSCIMGQARSITCQHPSESSKQYLAEKLIYLFRAYPSRHSRNFRYFVNKHLFHTLRDDLLQIWEAKAANVGNRTTGPKKAPTRDDVRSNDQSLEELLRTHGPQNGEIGGEKFWIKEHQDVLAHPADGTPSTDPDWTFPSGKLVFDELCLEGLRERFKKRPRQDTCHNTVQATRYPTFGLRKRMVRNRRFEQFPVSCEAYTLVYVVLQDARPVGSIVPLEQHTTERIIIPNQKWSNDCVVCSTKERQEHPFMKREEMRRKKLLTKSIFGCPQCNRKGCICMQRLLERFRSSNVSYMM